MGDMVLRAYRAVFLQTLPSFSTWNFWASSELLTHSSAIDFFHIQTFFYFSSGILQLLTESVKALFVFYSRTIYFLDTHSVQTQMVNKVFTLEVYLCHTCNLNSASSLLSRIPWLGVLVTRSSLTS